MVPTALGSYGERNDPATLSLAWRDSSVEGLRVRGRADRHGIGGCGAPCCVERIGGMWGFGAGAHRPTLAIRSERADHQSAASAEAWQATLTASNSSDGRMNCSFGVAATWQATLDAK